MENRLIFIREKGKYLAHAYGKSPYTKIKYKEKESDNTNNQHKNRLHID